MAGLVVGTAGHIDHGKTALVYALTGIDTDRLKEEKQRGISIDLGFAQMQLPDGETISFVDVPGHERFVRNMLAGAAGIEAVLLIVAANESVMPQTREHFEICRLLGLRHGLIVLTKCDIATEQQRAQTRMDVRRLVSGSFLADAPLIEVSAITRSGLDKLIRSLTAVAKQESGRDSTGVMRMPIDRSFSVKGFGTVVTGTLLSGIVGVGAHLEVLPQKAKVRVRGLQSQHQSVREARAGQRIAMNIAGVEQQSVQRGQVLTATGTLSTSRTLDVELHWLDMDTPPSSRELFTVHLGTAESGTRISLWSKQFARLQLRDEMLALPGDRFVLRRPSPPLTMGGGVVVDAFPPLRMNRTKTLARLEKLSAADLSTRIQILIDEAPMGLLRTDIVRMTGHTPPTSDERLVSRRWIEGKRRALTSWLSEFHKANPNAAGAPLASARLGLDAAVAALVFDGFNGIRVEGELVALASHQAQFSAKEVAALQRMENAFRTGGFQPPSSVEVIAGAGIEPKKARSLMESLIKSKRLVRLPDELIFHSDVIAHIRSSLAQQRGLRFSVVEFKSWTSISRKFAIPLLEYLDQQNLTKRDGDVRIVL